MKIKKWRRRRMKWGKERVLYMCDVKWDCKNRRQGLQFYLVILDCPLMNFTLISCFVSLHFSNDDPFVCPFFYVSFIRFLGWFHSQIVLIPLLCDFIEDPLMCSLSLWSYTQSMSSLFLQILIFYEFVLINTLTFLFAGLTEDWKKILVVHDGLWRVSLLYEFDIYVAVITHYYI